MQATFITFYLVHHYIPLDDWSWLYPVSKIWESRFDPGIHEPPRWSAIEKSLVWKKRRPDQIAWTNILVCGSLYWPVFLEELRIAFYMWTDVIRMVFRLIWIQKCEFRQNTKSVIGIWSGEIWSDLHLVTSLILTDDKKIPDEKSFFIRA